MIDDSNRILVLRRKIEGDKNVCRGEGQDKSISIVLKTTLRKDRDHKETNTFITSIYSGYHVVLM